MSEQQATQPKILRGFNCNGSLQNIVKQGIEDYCDDREEQVADAQQKQHDAEWDASLWLLKKDKAEKDSCMYWHYWRSAKNKNDYLQVELNKVRVQFEKARHKERKYRHYHAVADKKRKELLAENEQLHKRLRELEGSE